MANAKQSTIEKFTALKEQLLTELTDVDVALDNLQREYDQEFDRLHARKDEIENALYAGAKKMEHSPLANETRVLVEPVSEKEADPESNGAGTTTAVETLKATLQEYPGASKQDLRKLLPQFSEALLKNTMTYASKHNIIVNRGTKPRPEWHVA